MPKGRLFQKWPATTEGEVDAGQSGSAWCVRQADSVKSSSPSEEGNDVSISVKRCVRGSSVRSWPKIAWSLRAVACKGRQTAVGRAMIFNIDGDGRSVI